jgi:hypothetical protein
MAGVMPRHGHVAHKTPPQRQLGQHSVATYNGSLVAAEPRSVFGGRLVALTVAPGTPVANRAARGGQLPRQHSSAGPDSA